MSAVSTTASPGWRQVSNRTTCLAVHAGYHKILPVSTLASMFRSGYYSGNSSSKPKNLIDTASFLQHNTKLRAKRKAFTCWRKYLIEASSFFLNVTRLLLILFDLLQVKLIRSMQTRSVVETKIRHTYKRLEQGLYQIDRMQYKMVQLDSSSTSLS